MKPIYAFVASGLLVIGGLIFLMQAQQLEEDYYGSGGGFSLSSCQIGALGNYLGFEPKGVDTAGCDAKFKGIESARTTSNVLFVGAAGSLGFGIYLQRGKRKGQ